MAREWRQTRQTDALRGEVRRRKDGPKPTSFKKLADEYLENWSKIEKAPSSYVRDCNSMKHIGAFFGTKLISEIKRRDIEGYVAHRKAAGPQPGTLNRELSCLRNMLRKAVDWELIESSPAWGVRKQREEVIEYEFLTEEEAERLVESCPPHLQPIVVLALNTGMRRGEMLQLEWRDVNLAMGMITIRQPKNHETRHVPMNQRVRDALMKHPKRIVDGKLCPYVFSTPKGEQIKSIRNGFDAALKRAGIDKHIRPHDMRHTFASHLVMKGVDLRTVAKLGGWKTLQMVMRYAHLAPEHLQAAVDVLTAAISIRGASSGGRLTYRPE